MTTDLWHKVISVVAVTAAGLVAFYVIFYFLKKWSANKKHFLPRLMEKYLHLPGVMLFVIITLNINLESFKHYLDADVFAQLRHTVRILLIVSIGFLLLRAVTFIRETLLGYYSRKEHKDYTLRRARTKFQLINRVVNVLIIIGTVSAVLMTFNNVKQLGTSLLASAGVAGIILGFAAQKSLGNLFAGIQIAISQPIKLDDTVIVNDQFGTVGEITLTYVVINTWDGKRLIVPINYFLENPFENWTRASPEVVGKVKIYADYTLPVDVVRKKAEQWIIDSGLWDKRSWGCVVTDATDKTMEIRVTMSAKNSDDAWEFECMMREKLITFIRENYPHALPTSRLNINENTISPERSGKAGEQPGQQTNKNQP